MNVSSASISLSLATFRSQALGALISSSSTADNDALWATIAGKFATQEASADPLSMLGKSGDVKGLSAAGRNLGLYDPESAYKMMSVINGKDVSHKAQFSELSEMKSYLAQMQDAGQSLGGIEMSASNEEITSRLQNFVGQYNGWVERFSPDMENGGLLADMQAAQVSRYELKQSIENIFNGARDGVHGLADLGVSIDPNSKLASLDTARLGSLLAGNRQGGIDALQEFSANFAKSASLLNSDGNFIPNQLNNLSRVIDYYAENKTSLQSEFGTGDPAKPSGQVARALAAYNQRFGV